jgi:YD repeat-containing protein
MNRLTNAEVYNSSNQEGQDWSYSYDKAGNRTQSSVLSSGATTTYSYNAAEELTKTVQGSTTVTYSYDANGNLTSSTDGNSFTYNKKNQTTAINGNSYSYSGPDQTERVSVNSTTDAYSGLGLSYETNSSGTTSYTRCSCGMLLNVRPASGGKDYYLFDGQGSVVGLTDSNGNEVNAYDYDPFGNILNTGINPVANPFQYEGGYFESSTGLGAILLFLLGYSALADQIISIGAGLIFLGIFLAVFIPILGIILVVVGFFGTLAVIIIALIYLGRQVIAACSG